MAARIVHFGMDFSYRLAILAHAGFEVVECDSLEQFCDTLRNKSGIVAVILSEGEGRTCAAKQAAKLAHSECKAPVILFRSAAPWRQYPEIDLVIPSLTEPSVWLEEIHQLLERSRTIVSEGQALREQSKLLTQQSAELRTKMGAASQDFMKLRSKFEKKLGQGKAQSKKAG